MPDPTDARLTPQARYILPSFIEHSSWGVKESNPYNKLFEERIISVSYTHLTLPTICSV